MLGKFVRQTGRQTVRRRTCTRSVTMFRLHFFSYIYTSAQLERNLRSENAANRFPITMIMIRSKFRARFPSLDPPHEFGVARQLEIHFHVERERERERGKREERKSLPRTCDVQCRCNSFVCLLDCMLASPPARPLARISKSSSSMSSASVCFVICEAAAAVPTAAVSQSLSQSVSQSVGRSLARSLARSVSP